MSVIIIQIGQCGNQLGLTFFKDLIKEANSSCESVKYNIFNNFFHVNTNLLYKLENKLIANAILIDMESKVIDNCFKESKLNKFNYCETYVIKKQSGSGNNWANGFLNHGPSIEEDFVNKMSLLIDTIDSYKNNLLGASCVDSVLVINSLAGGTGSGLGAYVNILLNDYFPNLNLYSINFWPSNTGEVVVNSYNTLLSISESYKAVDLMIIFKNQKLFDTCKSIFKINKINYDHINSIASRQLLSCFIPVIESENNIENSKLNIWSVTDNYKSTVSRVCKAISVDCKFKLSNIICNPEIPDDQVTFNNDSWSSLIKENNENIFYNYSTKEIDSLDNQNTSSSNKLNKFNKFKTKKEFDYTYIIKSESRIKYMTMIFRGQDLDNVPLINNNKINILKTSHNFKNIQKHLSYLINSDFLNNNMNNTIDKASLMLNSKVFTHHYYKYGLEYADFTNSLSFCNQIIYDYINN